MISAREIVMTGNLEQGISESDGRNDQVTVMVTVYLTSESTGVTMALSSTIMMS
jgi:hypothetical protein